MGETLNYKDLPVVQRAFQLVQAVHKFVKMLPSTPQGRTIGDQLFRAATSIGANIAEGRGRDLGKEYEWGTFALPELRQMRPTTGFMSRVIANCYQWILLKN